MGECGEYGPWYYRLLTEPPSLEFLAKERHKILKKLHGRKRLQASEELCEYQKIMVGCFKRGRLKIFLCNLLSEQKPQFTCDTVKFPLTDMYINHPEELAWTLSTNLQDWFKKPDHHLVPITEADGDWEKLGTDRNAFCMATDYLGIPDKYLGFIWEALTTVPQQTELRETLRTPLTKAQMEEEFLRAIKDIKKSTTPGCPMSRMVT